MIEKKKDKKFNLAPEVLIKPWITEAATVAMELNKYIFKVGKKATKIQIRQAVEKLYKVKVISVRTINLPGKTRTRGNIKGRKPGVKKAIITLKKGDSIDIYGEKDK